MIASALPAGAREGFEPWGDQECLVATPNSFERSVIASNGDSATSASSGVAAISFVISTVPRTVVVTVVVAVAHTHATNRGINSYLCGRRYHRRGDRKSVV